MSRIVYLTGLLLSSITMVYSIVSGNAIETVVERSLVTFLGVMALFIVFNTILKWGLHLKLLDMSPPVKASEKDASRSE